jgi:hypothetical protein
MENYCRQIHDAVLHHKYCHKHYRHHLYHLAAVTNIISTALQIQITDDLSTAQSVQRRGYGIHNLGTSSLFSAWTRSLAFFTQRNMQPLIRRVQQPLSPEGQVLSSAEVKNK